MGVQKERWCVLLLMQELIRTPNMVRFGWWCAGAQMPDGYVKMLFPPTEFIQDPVVTSLTAPKWSTLCEKKIHYRCLTFRRLLRYYSCYHASCSVKVFPKKCFFVSCLSIQFYVMNKNSSAGELKMNQFIEEKLTFKASASAFSSIQRKIIKANIKVAKKNVFLSEHWTAGRDRWPPHAVLTFLGSE